MEVIINAKGQNKPLENIAQNAIIGAELKDLRMQAKKLARQLSEDQLRAMINHFQRKEPIGERA
jgi:hypothetical protein